MDQFDDLPDVVEKDTKPKFETEVHSHGPTGNAAGSGQGIPNGLQPIDWGQSADKQEAEDAATGNELAEDVSELNDNAGNNAEQ